MVKKSEKSAGKIGKQVPKRVKAGTSKAAAEARRTLFIAAYIRNGQNATQAAIAAGYAPKGAEQAGMRLKRDSRVRAAIAGAIEAAAKIAGLDVDRTLLEVARLAYSDPRKFYREDGSLIPVRELDDDAAACVAQVEVDEIKSDGLVLGHTVKLKQWDKNAALEKAMKYHGLYKADNDQKPIPTNVSINVVGIEPAPRR